jgi:hypothetical protein
MEGKDDHGPATSQLTPLQVDLVNPPKDQRSTLIGKNVTNSEELDDFQNISDCWPVPPNPRAINIIVQFPLSKRWVQ